MKSRTLALLAGWLLCLFMGRSSSTTLALTQAPVTLPDCSPTGRSLRGLAASPFFEQDQILLLPDGPTLWRSTDAGAAWQSVYAPPPDFDDLGSIVIAPLNSEAGLQLYQYVFPADQTLFGLAYSHLLKSEDGGASWQHLYPEDEDPCQYPSDRVWKVALSPDYAADNTIFMSTSPAYNRIYLYASYDGGNHWRSILGPHAPWNIQIRRRPQDTIQVTYLPLLLHGPAAGSPTLHRIYLPLASGSGALPKLMPLTIFAQDWSENIYYRSDNGGVSWRCLNLPP